ncbi:MAG: hypothetical protein AAF404_16435 [Pseudomonadota bacterium]
MWFEGVAVLALVLLAVFFVLSFAREASHKKLIIVIVVTAAFALVFAAFMQKLPIESIDFF